MQGLTAASHQAGPADDRGGNGVQDVLAALHVVGHAVQVRGVEQHADARGEGAQHEGGGADQPHVDARTPGGFGVATDRVDVPAVLRPAEEDRPGPQHCEHDGNDPGHAFLDDQHSAVYVADRDHDERGRGDHADLDQRDARRWRDESALSAPRV